MRRFWNMILGRGQGQNNDDEEDRADQPEENQPENGVPVAEEEEAPDEPRDFAQLMQLLQQLRPRQQGEGEQDGDEDPGAMQEFLERLLGPMNGQAMNNDAPSPQNAINEQMYQAARAGDLAELQRAVRSGADLRYRRDCHKPIPAGAQFGGPKIKTALHVGSSKGHAEIVEFILDTCPESVQDISPDLRRSALHYACNRKSTVKVLTLLVEKGQMDVNQKSLNDWTPFHYAVSCARLDMAKYLASKGAQVHAELATGGNAVTLAACTKNTELVKWLLDQGVSPNVQDKQGLTALHRLARFGDLTLTKFLVEYGNADVHLLDNSGCSVMEEADRNNMSEIATYMWSRGCESSSIKNPDGLGPTAWFRVRHINMPSSRYGCGLASMGSKLVLFSGLGQGPDHVNHDSDNHLPPDAMTQTLKDTYLADLNEVTYESMLPAGVNPARPDVSLSSIKIGSTLRLDADGLGGWSLPFESEDSKYASLVAATKPFKREEQFGYFELHVINPGEARILTIGLVDDKFPMERKQPGWEKDSYGYHGDDGGCFHNNGAGKAWGERFNPGDVIGCGVNFTGIGEVFWTKNGKFLGVSHIGPQSDLYWPVIGVDNPGSIFRVNFGKNPFMFSFVVPTLKWTRHTQEDFGCTNGRLIPMPEVDEVLAIPDRLTALSSKVWLFNMRRSKWRTNQCIGVRPCVYSGSQHVRLGDAVYIWNTEKATREANVGRAGTPTLYKLDLEYWSWSELLSYNVLADSTIDDNLQPILSSDEEDSDSDNADDEDNEGDDDGDNGSQPRRAAAVAGDDEDEDDEHRLRRLQSASKKRHRSAILKRSAQLNTAADSSTEPATAAVDGAQSDAPSGDGEPATKLSPKEAMAARMHNLVGLLNDEFKDSFIVAMGNELVFVSHMKMLRVNPKNCVFSTAELGGTRPRITHHSSIAVGTDIVTFGGWDDRKQQNEVFILDTKAKLWYKPHTGGLLFPRPRNNHASIYYETKTPIFAMDPGDDTESCILAKHASSLPSYSSNASSSSSAHESTPSTDSKGANANDDLVYRFCIFAMGWNGTNTMNDIDFVALDTKKSSEDLGKVFDAQNLSTDNQSGIDFDIRFDVVHDGTTHSIGAHKCILWARSDHFKTLLTEEQLDGTSKLDVITVDDASADHLRALLKFLYTDHVNVIQLYSDYRQFIKVAQKYAPNHVQRLIAEYVLTKVYEPEKLNEELGELLESGAFTDVTFNVAGTIFKAHKVILIARSPYFRAMLTGGMSESRQEEIVFEDTTPEEFSALLKFLYTRTIDYEHISEYVLGLFSLATKCEARRLKTILESLIAFNLDSSNVASLLILADQLAANSLKKSCIEFIQRQPESVQYENSAQQQQVASLIHA